MSDYFHTVDTMSGGRLTFSADAKNDDLRILYKGCGTGNGYPILQVGTKLRSHQARQLYHLLDRIYNPAYDEEDQAQERVRVTQSTQEVTFLLRDEVCDCWTFRIGFNVVHYIEPPSDPHEGSSIRIEEFEKAEDLQLCLAAAIEFRKKRRLEIADAGFEIDSDDHLVIHGERVRE